MERIANELPPTYNPANPPTSGLIADDMMMVMVCSMLLKLELEFMSMDKTQEPTHLTLTPMVMEFVTGQTPFPACALLTRC